MPMKRRRLLLLLLLLLLLGGLLLVPSVRWPIYGWLRGEAFYQGMPASWWKKEIEANYQPIETLGSIALVGSPIWTVDQPLSFLAQLKEYLVPNTTPASVDLVTASPLLNGNPDALPMLQVLIRNGSAKVRRVAVSGLKMQGPVSEVIGSLAEALDDPDAAVRQDVAGALQQLRVTVRRKDGAE
jgi:hypothetical protein